jgi:hypothetical protein
MFSLESEEGWEIRLSLENEMLFKLDSVSVTLLMPRTGYI